MIRTCRVLLAPGFVNLSSGVNLAFDLPEPESPGQLKLEVRLWTFIGGSPYGNSELNTRTVGACATSAKFGKPEPVAQGPSESGACG